MVKARLVIQILKKSEPLPVKNNSIRLVKSGALDEASRFSKLLSVVESSPTSFFSLLSKAEAVEAINSEL